jgi:hypothetical protein
MAYVYRHIRLDKNEPFYIGIGSDNNYKRAYSIDSRNKHWQNITNKHLYEVDILLDNINIVDAKLKEIEFIKLYKRRLDGGTLCNITLGGEGANGLIRTKENKDKIAKFNTGKKRPKEVGEKISLKLKGRKLNANRIEKIRQRMIGNSYTSGIPLKQEHKNKISIANKGKMKEIVECPYCKIEGGLPALKRWHFENCKNK